MDQFLRSEIEKKRKENPLPPEIINFARSIRAEFGDGVRLQKGQPWVGGVNVRRKP